MYFLTDSSFPHTSATQKFFLSWQSKYCFHALHHQVLNVLSWCNTMTLYFVDYDMLPILNYRVVEILAGENFGK